LEGLSQPAWPNLSPVAWDYLETLDADLATVAGRLCAFKELNASYAAAHL
jgi:hypothetical protein